MAIGRLTRLLLLLGVGVWSGCNAQIDYGADGADSDGANSDEAGAAAGAEAQPGEAPAFMPEETPPAVAETDPPTAEPGESSPAVEPEPSVAAAPAEPPATDDPPNEEKLYDDFFDLSSPEESAAPPASNATPAPAAAASGVAPWEAAESTPAPEQAGRYGGLFDDVNGGSTNEAAPQPESEPTDSPPAEVVAESPTPEPAQPVIDPTPPVEPMVDLSEFDWQPPPSLETPGNESIPEEPVPPEPEPAETEPTLTESALPEPAPIEPTAEATPPVETPPPMPVDVDNTRHLAWVLGAKLGLAAVAPLMDSDGPSAALGEDWQVVAIAELLNVTPPTPSAEATEAAPALAAAALLREARVVGGELARRHGSDHAALFEVAVKTNLLLLLYRENPALAAPIQRAVEAAARRGKLPDGAWRPLVEVLANQPSEAELRSAVYRLQADVEKTLRGSIDPAPPTLR